MKTKLSTALFASLFAIGILFGGYSCTPSDDYITERELRTIVREELKSYLTETQIIQLINNLAPQGFSENEIRKIITEELKGALTSEQIEQIIKAVGQGEGQGLSEAQIRQIIKDELNKIAQTRWAVKDFTIEPNEWEIVQNEHETYYIGVKNFPELTKTIFDKGAVLSYYKLNDKAKTVLPFVKTTIGADKKPYTETYSCDLDLEPSRVTFTLEASDAGKYDANPPRASFQVVLIW